MQMQYIFLLLQKHSQVSNLSTKNQEKDEW